MYKPFWALLFLLSCTYSAAFADDPTSESKGWGGVAPAPSENECRSFIEAALKEQRTQVETDGDAAGEASTLALEEQIGAVDQVNEETTADASIENTESTEPSDAVEETNESVELSGTEPEGSGSSIEQEATTEKADESLTESAEAEPENVLTESTEAEGVPDESLETEGTQAESAEAESVEAGTESAEGEVLVAESAETGTEYPGAESVEAEGAPNESTEGEPEELVSQSAEGEGAEASAEASTTVADEIATESAETESTEEPLSDKTEAGNEEPQTEESATSVEAEVEQAVGDAVSAEETVSDGGGYAAENVVPESAETETKLEEPTSDEETILADQPIETDASQEVVSEQEAEPESEQVDEQPKPSAEQEEVSAEQPEVQEAEPENIVEEAAQESAENVIDTISEEIGTTGSEPIESEEQPKVEAEPVTEAAEESEQQSQQEVEESTITQTSSEETVESQEQPSETPTETVAEEPAITEEPVPTETETTPAAEAILEETPAENAASAEPESTSESQTEEVPEAQGVAETVVAEEVTEEETPEQEDLTLKIEVPENLRSRNHISEVLKLDSGSVDIEAKLLKAEESTLKELKRIYEAAIKPLEILYKYRDLSNRHFGDPEIFSKPLILFMGPWSGGKSTIINYLLDNEYKPTALRTGAEPSPAYFNIVMKGDREEILDGTQLAADWTFSGLQKFGQGLLDRLRGLRMNTPLLEKVNIVEIPGILEIRKQVERLFPLNDACQWFIDRADIIFLVYDPSKLDVGPETEAILDQLKGREYQTKIILNKADQVKPEELMRVQGTLIWNISPLMSSTEPPVMYSTSLWSHPYQPGSPSRLLFAQEKAFLKDLREAMEKRVENKISSARRFAVRVRNHAKMVDCYLTTYYNHKSFFGNKQKVSDDIIEHPQNYHIYEGLSTLTNISRYDLPDPDVYRDFFRLNPVYDFQQLASTCTYFKGCPINRLDVAIAYDLPELVGKYKKAAEDVKSQGKK